MTTDPVDHDTEKEPEVPVIPIRQRILDLGTQAAELVTEAEAAAGSEGDESVQMQESHKALYEFASKVQETIFDYAVDSQLPPLKDGEKVREGTVQQLLNALRHHNGDVPVRVAEGEIYIHGDTLKAGHNEGCQECARG